jgi:hypothetical protein
MGDRDIRESHQQPDPAPIAVPLHYRRACAGGQGWAEVTGVDVGLTFDQKVGDDRHGRVLRHQKDFDSDVERRALAPWDERGEHVESGRSFAFARAV